MWGGVTHHRCQAGHRSVGYAAHCLSARLQDRCPAPL